MAKVIISIDGMTCSACSNGLEKYISKQKGVISCSVNLVMANATIEYDNKILDISDLELFVKKAGFKSLGVFKEIRSDFKKRKGQKLGIITYTILALILMYISMGHMFYLPVIPTINPHLHAINHMIVVLSITIAFLFYGFDILKNGYKNLIHRTPNMDTLVGLGVITSFIYSIYNMYLSLNGNMSSISHLYFESTAMVIYFVKLGRYIDYISKDKTKDAIKKLVEITPNVAFIKKDGNETKVTLDEIKTGDIVVSRPGEKIAVDGKILQGSSHIDESFLTGESVPVHKTKGDMVIAGSLNYDGYIEYSAEKIGKESTISEIVKLVVEATNTKTKLSRLADKVSGYFVPIVILISLLTLITYLCLGKDLSLAINSFVSVLVVSCPCALGLATPLAMVLSEGICAKNGILIKKNEILENAKKIDTVVFDKTGTLTYGNLRIAKMYNYSEMDEKDIMQIVGSIESKSTHPISRAFTTFLSDNNIPLIDIQSFESIDGKGIVGTIDDIHNSYVNDEKSLKSLQNSIVYVAKNNTIIALIGVNDIIRSEAKEVINKLNDMNIETIMLTGDNVETANNIAKEIGIDKVIANVLPKDKIEVITKLQSENKFVLMCGDGINDSPAISSANIGVSLNSGTDIAMDSSDVILTHNNLKSILSLINISKKCVKVISQNLFWAFLYNILMIPIAMGLLRPIGLSISPMIASIAMILSSLTVILNTIRLRNTKLIYY